MPYEFPLDKRDKGNVGTENTFFENLNIVGFAILQDLLESS